MFHVGQEMEKLSCVSYGVYANFESLLSMHHAGFPGALLEQGCRNGANPYVQCSWRLMNLNRIHCQMMVYLSVGLPVQGVLIVMIWRRT
jgi:hypothetical protein